MSTLMATSRSRRRTDTAMRGLLGAATVVALIPLAVIVFYLLKKGVGALSWTFFTSDPSGASILGINIGGAKSAILGTLELVGVATAMAVPLGIAVALYLTEYGRTSRFGATVRYFVDVMTGVPSIVFGLFVYVTLVVGLGHGFAGWKGSVALALLMLPIVTRSAEVVLLLVPDHLREAALALGAPRWRVVTRIVLPTALPGLVTGSLLAIARGAGETAPLLFTATIVEGTTGDLTQRMNSLPAQIFNDIQQPAAAIQARAWGAALTLVALILLLSVAARLIPRRSRLT